MQNISHTVPFGDVFDTYEQAYEAETNDESRKTDKTS